MKTLLAALLLATPLPALAQGGQAPPAGMGGQQRSVPGVSEQGNAILNQAMGARDPQLEGVMRQQGQLRDQLNAAAMAQSIDVDKVAALIRQREDLQTQYRQLADARMLNALRQLPAADRSAFMRFLSSPPGGGRQQ